MKSKIILSIACLLICALVNAQNQSLITSSPENDLEFIPNKGQIEDMQGKSRADILYLAHAGPVEVFLRDKGLSYVISTLKNPKLIPGNKDDDTVGQEVVESHHHWLKLRNEPFKICRVDMDFVGALHAVTKNHMPTDGFLNYYNPLCPNGITNIKAYESVLYKGIYPNIDISFKGTFNKGLKYDLIINPGGNPDIIKMKYTGTEDVQIADGKLLLIAFTGKMEEKIPKIYQNINGTEVNIEGEYVLYHKGKDSLDGTIVGIKVKNYNKAYPLVIDPWWASYCGGSADDEAYACALDNPGNTLVSGVTTSTNFPVSVGAFQTSLVGSMNAFVVKFDQNGHRLWATYYGGSGSDGAYGITADINNNVFITGNTTSTNFPVSAGAFQTLYGGSSEDAFVVKFDPNGIRQWGTYCGGSGYDIGNAVTTDYAGNVAITGYTNSNDFPVSLAAFQTTFGGAYDAFVVKFDPNGNQLWGTYFGGASNDESFGISADSKGNIAFTGITYSTNFPISAGCFQSTPDNGFVAELDPSGNRLWATYYGMQGNGCAVDKSNNVVIAGVAGDAVATPGVFQTTFTTGDGFAAKFNPGGNRVWATFNNTNVSEGGDYAMTVDDANNVYLEDDEEPPSHIGPSCAFQRRYTNNQECVYIVKLDSNAKYSCSTYTCGTIYDEHEYTSANLAAHNGRMAIAGYTSGGIPTTPGVLQTTFPGGAYAPFVFNLCSFACGDTLPPNLTVSNIIVKSDSCLGYVGFSAHATAPCDSEGATFIWSFPGGNPSSATGPNISNILFGTAGTYTVKLKYIACSVDSISQTFTVKSGFHDSLAVINPANCHQLGQATAYPSSGDAPYTYSWSNGVTTQSDTGLGTGTYTCVVTANNGCRDTLTFKIKSPISPPFVTKPKLDTGFCIGSSVTLNVSGGTNFLWAPSSGLSCTSCPSPIATPTATTIYSIIGLDSVGCPDSAKITITVDSIPRFILTATPEGCGGYTLVEANSSADLTWTWTPTIGLTYTSTYYNDASPPSQTTYTVTASNGYCSSSDTITIAPVPTSFPLKIKAIPDTVCQGAIISLIASSTSPVTTWRWQNATGLSCNSCYDPSLNTSLITVVGNTYTIALEAEDSARCIAFDTITIHINSNHITAQSIKICKGSSTTLISDSSATYSWSNGSTTRTITVTPPATSVYYVVIDSGGCKDSVFYTVIIDKGPPIAVSTAKDTVCPGSSTSMLALGAQVVTWLWTPGIGLSCYNCHNPVATVNSQITYTVTGIDSTGCISKDSITLYNISGASVYQSHFLCKGSSITLTVTDGNSYQWSNGATTTSIIVSPPDTATYYSIVTFNGGCSDTVFQTVDVHTGPSVGVSIVPDSICLGKSALLTANSAKVVSWSWTPSATLTCNNCPNPTASPTVTTTYLVSGKDSLGCITTDTLTLKVIALPVAAIIASKDTVCSGDSVLLIGLGGSSYKWSTLATTDSIYVFPVTAQTYTLTVTKNGCTDSIIKTIHIFNATISTVSLSKDSICLGDTVVLSVSGGTSYNWSNGSTNTSIVVAPQSTTSYTVTTQGKCQHDTLIKTIHVVPSPKPIITGSTTACVGKKDTLYASGGTTYLWSTGSTNTSVTITLTKDSSVTLQAFNGKCYKDTTIKLTLIPSPTVTITSPVKICSGDTVTLTATGGGSYHWSTGSTDSSIVVNPTTTTTYFVVVTNLKDCSASSSTKVTIDVPAIYACCDSTIINGNSVALFANSSYTYKWYPSAGISCDSCAEVIVSPTVTTTYTVIGKDKEGCEVAKIITITVEAPCNNYFVPNVFTPNNDDVNDQFEIKTENLTSYSIIIYDRWGKEMYKSSNPLVYWNGNTEQGDKAPDGVYYYIITSTCRNSIYKKDGFVQLIR